MTALSELEAATTESAFARDRLNATARELQARLSPQRLLDDAMDSAVTKASGLIENAEHAARRSPRIAVGIGVALVLVLVRKPLKRVFRRKRRVVED